MLQAYTKSTHQHVVPQHSTKNNKIAVTDIREKPVDLFNGTARASTLALAIILLNWVPLQKFPFLFNLQFLGDERRHFRSSFTYRILNVIGQMSTL